MWNLCIPLRSTCHETATKTTWRDHPNLHWLRSKHFTPFHHSPLPFWCFGKESGVSRTDERKLPSGSWLLKQLWFSKDICIFVWLTDFFNMISGLWKIPGVLTAFHHLRFQLRNLFLGSQQKYVPCGISDISHPPSTAHWYPSGSWCHVCHPTHRDLAGGPKPKAEWLESTINDPSLCPKTGTEWFEQYAS